MNISDAAPVLMGRCDALLSLTDEIRKMNVPRLEKRLGTLVDKLLDERNVLVKFKEGKAGEVMNQEEVTQ